MLTTFHDHLRRFDLPLYRRAVEPFADMLDDPDSLAELLFRANERTLVLTGGPAHTDPDVAQLARHWETWLEANPPENAGTH